MGFGGSLCYVLNKHARGSIAHRLIQQDKAPQGKGSKDRWSDSTQIIPRARSETGGKPAFPDSQSGDGTMGLMATSRKE